MSTKWKQESILLFGDPIPLARYYSFFLTEGIVYFLNTVHYYKIYEIQLHKALCEFAVKKGYCWLKEGLPPPTHKKKYVVVLEQ
jgi:hypothetical protein